MLDGEVTKVTLPDLAFNRIAAPFNVVLAFVLFPLASKIELAPICQ